MRQAEPGITTSGEPGLLELGTPAQGGTKRRARAAHHQQARRRLLRSLRSGARSRRDRSSTRETRLLTVSAGVTSTGVRQSALADHEVTRAIAVDELDPATGPAGAEVLSSGRPPDDRAHASAFSAFSSSLAQPLGRRSEVDQGCTGQIQIEGVGGGADASTAWRPEQAQTARRTAPAPAPRRTPVPGVISVRASGSLL